MLKKLDMSYAAADPLETAEVAAKYCMSNRIYRMPSRSVRFTLSSGAGQVCSMQILKQ